MREQIITDPARLPNLPADEAVVWDTETTSFRDKIKALKPYHGHRICGYAFTTRAADMGWYVPMRHHTGDPNENMPIEPARKFLQDLLGSGRDIGGHNIKFDLHFGAQDGAFCKGRMLDTMVLFRLIHNDLLSYSLDALAERYLKERKGGAPTAYLKSIHSEDYGRVPVKVLGRYSIRDAMLTARLLNVGEERLPAFSNRIWDIEVQLTKVLFESERHGILLDRVRMKRTKARCLREMIEANQKCNEYAEEEMDPGRELDQTRILIGKFGIEPTGYTKTGKPQWTQIALNSLAEEFPICRHIARYNRTHHFLSTYIDGWLERVSEEGRMHADYHQAGALTGRLSCRNPNMQNVPVEAESFVVVPEHYVLMAFDWSQIEYRFFGHYSNDPTIVGSYQKDRKTDFHGLLAGLLGVERQFAKQLNFSFLYGMGKKLLLANIAGILQLAGAENPAMRDTMLRNFVMLTHGKAAKQMLTHVSVEEQNELLAENIYAEYHKKFPSIKTLRLRIDKVIRSRGWLRNYYGRRYYLEPRFSYKGPNYLIQGSAADFLKDRAVAVHDGPQQKYGAFLLMNIHDALVYAVPQENVIPFYLEAKRVMEPDILRIPIIVEGKVAKSCWGQVIKIDPHLEDENKIRKTINAGIAKSTLVEMREWGVFKTAEQIVDGDAEKHRRTEEKVRGRYWFQK